MQYAQDQVNGENCQKGHAGIVFQPNNSLQIMSVEEFDKGIYKCVAANSLGKSYDTTEVIVEGKK